MPSGTEVHIGVYDFHERQHAQLQQRRNDLVSLLMYLTERRLFFSVNHVFSSVTGRRESEDFEWFENYFPAVETRNSHMLESANAAAAALAMQWNKVAIGGSDAHALASVGTAYTEVSGARNKEEFFAALRSGRAAWWVSRAVSQSSPAMFSPSACEMMREKHWTALLAPLAVLVPAITCLNYYNESSFRRRWAPQILNQPELPKRHAWIADAANGCGGIDMTVGKVVWNQIQSNDHRLMRRVHRWRAPRWFRILMIAATRGGDGWLWYTLGLILLIYGGDHRFAAIGAGSAAA